MWATLGYSLGSTCPEYCRVEWCKIPLVALETGAVLYPRATLFVLTRVTLRLHKGIKWGIPSNQLQFL